MQWLTGASASCSRAHVRDDVLNHAACRPSSSSSAAFTVPRREQGSLPAPSVYWSLLFLVLLRWCDPTLFSLLHLPEHSYHLPLQPRQFSRPALLLLLALLPALPDQLPPEQRLLPRQWARAPASRMWACSLTSQAHSSRMCSCSLTSLAQSSRMCCSCSLTPGPKFSHVLLLLLLLQLGRSSRMCDCSLTPSWPPRRPKVLACAAPAA